MNKEVAVGVPQEVSGETESHDSLNFGGVFSVHLM